MLHQKFSSIKQNIQSTGTVGLISLWSSVWCYLAFLPSNINKIYVSVSLIVQQIAKWKSAIVKIVSSIFAYRHRCMKHLGSKLGQQANLSGRQSIYWSIRCDCDREESWRLSCYKSPFLGLRRVRLKGIITPPYPGVTLDNFGFPVDDHFVVQRTVFWPLGQMLAIFGYSHIARESMSNFSPGSKKLSGIIQVTKNGPHCQWRWFQVELQRNGRFCVVKKHLKSGQKPFFFQINPPRNVRLKFICEKGGFSSSDNTYLQLFV